MGARVKVALLEKRVWTIVKVTLLEKGMDNREDQRALLG